MKRLVATLFVVSTILLPIDHAFAQKTVRRIAVYDFDDKLVQGEIQKTYGENKNIGALVAAWVSQALVQTPGFEVIDRKEIEQIMKEQNLHDSGRFDPSDAPRIGKLLNVDAIVTGSVQQMHSSARSIVLPIRLPGVGSQITLHADATVSIQVVSTETAKIFWADKSNAKKDQSVDSGTVQSSPVAPVMDAALELAVGKVSSGIADRIVQLPPRQVDGVEKAELTKPTSASGGEAPKPVSTTSAPPAAAKAISVGHVEGKEVYIRAGKNDGLKVGQLVEIRRVSGKMSDGNGGEISIEKTVETEVITEVNESYSVAEPQKGAQSQAHENDTVRLTSATNEAHNAK